MRNTLNAHVSVSPLQRANQSEECSIVLKVWSILKKRYPLGNQLPQQFGAIHYFSELRAGDYHNGTLVFTKNPAIIACAVQLRSLEQNEPTGAKFFVACNTRSSHCILQTRAVLLTISIAKLLESCGHQVTVGFRPMQFTLTPIHGAHFIKQFYEGVYHGTMELPTEETQKLVASKIEETMSEDPIVKQGTNRQQSTITNITIAVAITIIIITVTP